MANTDHFKDRSPYICAAGKPSAKHEDIAQNLKNYPLNDIVDALKHEANIPDKEPTFKYKLPPLINSRNQGIFTEIKGVLGLPVESRFQTLVNDLKETTYRSYWDAGLGKVKDPVGNLPVGIDAYSTTFGKPSTVGPSVRELVNPDKLYGQVLKEYIEGHEMYRKTHNDYYPNEHKDRKYLKPAYDPNRVYGERNGYDPRGLMMKCCLKSDKNDYNEVNTVLAEFQKRFTPKLGKPLTPNNNINCVPRGHTFGKPSIRQDSIAELCTENPKPKIQEELEYYLTHINPLRANLKKRFNKNLFSFDKFLDALKYHDKEKSGWIPLSTAHEMCACFKLFYNRIEIENFLKLFGIIRGDQIDYKRFVDALNWQADIPDIGETYYVPPKVYYYETTTRGAREDYKYIDNTGHRPAGLSSTRLDLDEPRAPEGGCRADIDSLGAQTDAKTIMYPSVNISYGLSFYDFFAPRGKEQIRKIFTNVGYKIDDDTFEKMWNESCETDKTGLVCVETFKNLIKKYNIEYKNEEKDKKN